MPEASGPPSFKEELSLGTGVSSTHSHTPIAATIEKGALCSESADNCLQLDTRRTLAGSSLYIFLGSHLFVTCDTGFLNNAIIWASLVAQMVKSLPANAGDMGSIPWLRRSSGGGNGNPLQCSCLDRGTWQATVLEVTESDKTKQLTLNN